MIVIVKFQPNFPTNVGNNALVKNKSQEKSGPTNNHSVTRGFECANKKDFEFLLNLYLPGGLPSWTFHLLSTRAQPNKMMDISCSDVPEAETGDFPRSQMTQFFPTARLSRTAIGDRYANHTFKPAKPNFSNIKR
jgi:hypothetical protein